jgi:branched-chain amino acid transport system ATP-binding protein
VVVDQLYAALQDLRDNGVSLLLVEQQTRRATEFANRGYVLQSGRIVQAGSARELLDSEDVRRAYMGM